MRLRTMKKLVALPNGMPTQIRTQPGAANGTKVVRLVSMKTGMKPRPQLATRTGTMRRPSPRKPPRQHQAPPPQVGRAQLTTLLLLPVTGPQQLAMLLQPVG